MTNFVTIHIMRSEIVKMAKMEHCFAKEDGPLGLIRTMEDAIIGRKIQLVQEASS